MWSFTNCIINYFSWFLCFSKHRWNLSLSISLWLHKSLYCSKQSLCRMIEAICSTFSLKMMLKAYSCRRKTSTNNARKRWRWKYTSAYNVNDCQTRFSHTMSEIWKEKNLKSTIISLINFKVLKMINIFSLILIFYFSDNLIA